MKDDFPRLLVATEFPPNAAGGGPAIVRQMLKDWPAEKICWWSCVPDTDQRAGQKVAAHAVARIPPRCYPNRRLTRPKSWLLENVWSHFAAKHFQKTLEALKPDVVWAIPHCWSIPALAKILPAGKTGFHVSIHDFPDCDFWVRSFGAPRCRRLLALTENLYARAATRDAIGREMVDNLRERTGGDGIVIRSGLEAGDFARLETPAAGGGEKIRIAYAGTIHVEDVFARFVAALGKIRGRMARPVALDFFGNHSYRAAAWFDATWMHEHGNLPAKELNAALRNCSWGFLPMSLADEDPRYNHFSLPTKFVSYLAAGLPIITLGHPESGAVKMSSAYGTGACLTSQEPEVLAEQLFSALGEPNPGIKFHPGIRRCALNEFDAVRMRAALHDCLKKCASVSHPI